MDNPTVLENVVGNKLPPTSTIPPFDETYATSLQRNSTVLKEKSERINSFFFLRECQKKVADLKTDLFFGFEEMA